jgi:hypothetical protein
MLIPRWLVKNVNSERQNKFQSTTPLQQLCTPHNTGTKNKTMWSELLTWASGNDWLGQMLLERQSWEAQRTSNI